MVTPRGAARCIDHEIGTHLSRNAAIRVRSTRLRAHIAKEIEWFRGREVDMVGDRPLAIFDGPARAIRCALAITEYASRLGVETRAGLHTGECEIVDGIVPRQAAKIGECVANEADVREVLVSGTVKDLVAGSGIKLRTEAFARWRRVASGACSRCSVAFRSGMRFPPTASVGLHIQPNPW